MRIVEVIPSFYPVGGAERLVYSFCNYLKNENSDIELLVICLYDQDERSMAFELIKHCVRVEFAGKKRGVDFRCAKKVGRLIKEFAPDVIHAHLNSLLTLFLARAHRYCPVYYTIHTLIDKSVIGSVNKPLNALYRYLFKTHKVKPIAIADEIRQSVENYYGLKEASVPVVLNGVGIPDETTLLPLSERPIDFVFLGRFVELKNVENIIAAFEIASQRKEMNMTMAGEGPLLEECKMRGKNINNLTILGHVNDPESLIKSSKVLILVSKYEGNPMVINEAIAHKTYVLATSVGGIPSVVIDGVGHLIAPDFSIDELADQMLHSIDGLNKKQKDIDLAYPQALPLVSLGRMTNDYLSVFKQEKKA